MTYIIRQAELDDVSSILSIRYQAIENKLTRTITYDMIYACLKKDCRAWVAELDGNIVGFSLANKKLKNIWGLFVIPSCQGQGIGRSLLFSAVKWLQNESKTFYLLPCRKIWLNTEINGRAESFYQHLGWQKGRQVSATEVRYWYHIK